MRALWAIAACAVMITAACSVAPGSGGATTGTSTTAEMEQQLREIVDSGAEYLVIIDRDNYFWAIPVSDISNIIQNKIYLDAGTTVGLKKPTGRYNEKDVAASLIRDLERAGDDSFSFTIDESGNLLETGITKSLENDVVVRVKKIVSISD